MRTPSSQHRAASMAAALVALALVSPATAGSGLPRLGDLQAGPYQLALYNDSPSLVTGRNVLTVEVPAAIAGSGVQFELVGPDGIPRPVKLKRVAMLGETNADHGGEHADGHEATSAGPTEEADAQHANHDAAGHGAPQETAPGAAAATGHGASGHASGVGSAAPLVPSTAAPVGAAGEPVLLRGQVNLPRTGTWLASVTVTGPAGDVHRSDVVALEVVQGGPNRWYVAVTGSLVAIALVVGVVGRRRMALVPQSKGR